MVFSPLSGIYDARSGDFQLQLFRLFSLLVEHFSQFLIIFSIEISHEVVKTAC